MHVQSSNPGHDPERMPPREGIEVRKAYVAPALRVLGRLQELTTGGSVNKHENGGHPNGLP